MRVGVYLRVSTPDQEVENQRPDLLRFIRDRGWDLAKEYTDTGVSGAKVRRPGLNALMADARKGKLDVVMVWRFDRFARSAKHLVNALYEFRELGIRFISCQEKIDLGTSMGEAMFTIIAAVSQLERDIIGERVAMGLRRARAIGVVLGRPVVKVPVEKIDRLRQKGLSIRAIGKELGIPKTRVEKALKKLSKDPVGQLSLVTKSPESNPGEIGLQS